jgi:hypothetical protein
MLDQALAWARAQPPGSRPAVLAETFVTGTTRVAIDGRVVEYRDLAELERALIALWRAEMQPRRVRMVRITSGKGV